MAQLGRINQIDVWRALTSAGFNWSFTITPSLRRRNSLSLSLVKLLSVDDFGIPLIPLFDEFGTCKNARKTVQQRGKAFAVAKWTDQRLILPLISTLNEVRKQGIHEWHLCYLIFFGYIYIYISNIQSASEDSGCGLFLYRIYEEYHIKLCVCSMYGYYYTTSIYCYLHIDI